MPNPSIDPSDPGQLRAYLDDALSPAERAQVASTLAESAEVRARLAELRQTQTQVEQALSALGPSGADTSPAAQALHHLQAQLAASSAHPTTGSLKERMLLPMSSIVIKQYKSALAILAVVLTAGVALSFAPVRAFAGDLLNIFRVQEVRVIPVDRSRIEELEANEEFSSLMDQFSPEKEVLVDGGDPQTVDSLTEAQAAVDFQIAQITNLPADAPTPVTLKVHPQSIFQSQLDPGLMEAIFEAGGIPIDLPDSLNDTPIVVTKPPMVTQVWGDPDAPESLVLAQLETPQIEYPDDLDLDEFGVAVLQLLGQSEADARALAASIDWANTLILPAPTDKEMTVSEVSIHGVKGVLFHREAEGKKEVGIMWNQGGLSYLLKGPYSPEQMVSIAQSVQ